MVVIGTTRCDDCNRDVFMRIHRCPDAEPQSFATLGDRMKSYESSVYLDKKQAVIVRVDGKAFHTWTKKVKADKPFDYHIIEAMQTATILTANEIQGCKLAYTQSDEATFCLIASGEREEGWFGYKPQKIASLVASYFTYFFNEAFEESVMDEWHSRPTRPGFFDGRDYNVPLSDAANVFVWRQKDWQRNSIQMLGQAHFSHSKLQGKSNKEVLDMLSTVGVDWNKLRASEKFGTFISKSVKTSEKLNYTDLNKLLGIKEEYATN